MCQDDDNDRRWPYVNAYEGWGEGRRACSTGMIVDILDRDDSRQILGIRFARFAKPITTRSEPGEPATTIDDANVQIAEPYHLVTGLELRDADSFTHQRLADENALAL